jgi:hypothetical protein
MKRAGVAVILAAVLTSPCALAAKKAKVNNYPTLDRVQYVEECIQDHPERQRQEMIYKCSCALDEVAKHVPYDLYIDLATSFKASSIAGERGALREGAHVKSMVKRYREVQADAYKACFIQQ